MSTITATHADTPGVPGGHTISWGTMGNGDDGSWEYVGHLTDKCVHLAGTLTDVDIQGSLDGGTTSAVLNDPQGNALADGTARIEQILENAPYIRPLVTTGTGVTVKLFGRKVRS